MIHDDRADCRECVSPSAHDIERFSEVVRNAREKYGAQPTATTSETYLWAASLLVLGVMGLGFALGWW